MPAPIDSRNAAKFAHLIQRFDEVAEVDGDVVECGVAGGMTFSMLALLIKMEGRERSLWGFDSFQGFPTPSTHDEGRRNPQKGELGNHTGEQVTNLLRGAGIAERSFNDRIHLAEGFFDEALVKYSGGLIALLHLDVDLHDSYRQCLEVC